MSDVDERIRAAFEEEARNAPVPPGLRGRVIARAVGGETVRSRQSRGWSAWPRPVRLVTAVAAVALVAVAAGSAGAILDQRSRSQPGSVALGTASPAVSPPPPPSSAPTLGYGRLPGAVLEVPTGRGGGAAPVAPYYGPAMLSWSGQLPQIPAVAPVIAVTPPGPAEADAFAAAIGATPEAAGGGGSKGPRRYRAPGGVSLQIDLAGPGGPGHLAAIWSVSAPLAAPAHANPTDAGARSVADELLHRLHLQPAGPLAVSVDNEGGTATPSRVFAVHYRRLIGLGSAGGAPIVNAFGDPAGIEVILDWDSASVTVDGPLPGAEATADYPLGTGATAVQAAIATPVDLPPDAPIVDLDRAVLVYLPVRAGARDYLEPAYLFTGRFALGGQSLEKRVIVPALAVEALAP